MKPKRDAKSQTFKKHKMSGGLVVNTIRKGEWQLVKENSIPGAPKKKGRTGSKPLALTKKELQNMAMDKAGGMSHREIGRKYNLSDRYVEAALIREYAHNKKGREALRGLLLEGAIATTQRVHEKVGELTATQSVIAASALTSRYIELDKHISTSIEEVDVKELLDIGSDLRALTNEIGDDFGVDGIIDVPSQVTALRLKDKKHISKKSK